MVQKEHNPEDSLEYLGLHGLKKIHWNLAVPVLYEHAVCSREGQLASDGPLVVTTGEHTGRAAKDK